MEVITLKSWKLRADSYQTELAYRTITGATQSCGCHWCANFVAAREEVYPSEILVVLTDLGIDYTKEADLYQQAIDAERRMVLYRWWFYCVGYIEEGRQAWEYEGGGVWNKQLEVIRDSPRYFGVGFSDSARRRSAEEHHVPLELKPYSLVQAEFNAEVPWVLDAPLPGGL